MAGTRSIALALVACALAPLASAQLIPGPLIPGRPRPTRPPHPPVRLFVVDDTPAPCVFASTIQPAVDAARNGDVILVKSGVYPYFRIDGKSLCVVGEGRPQINSAVRIENLLPDQRVVLRGFSLSSGPFVWFNEGPVWIEDCTWSYATSTQARSSTLGMFRCQLVDCGSSAGAVYSEDSTFFAYHSLFSGRRGADAWFDSGLCEDSGGYECDYWPAQTGLNGISLVRSAGYLSACSLSGGNGGLGYFASCGCIDGTPGSVPDACGGEGLTLFSSSAVLLQTGLAGGTIDCNGMPYSGTGLVTLTGQTGAFQVDTPVDAGDPLHFTFQGPPGWEVYIALSDEYAPEYDAPLHGMSVVPPEQQVRFLGVLPPSGVLDLTQSYGDLVDPADGARVIFVQAKFHDPVADYPVLGTPSAVVVVRDPCP